MISLSVQKSSPGKDEGYLEECEFEEEVGYPWGTWHPAKRAAGFKIIFFFPFLFAAPGLRLMPAGLSVARCWPWPPC